MTPIRFISLRRRFLGASVALVALACPGHAATRIEGLSFDDRIQLGGTELVLNGVGLRAVVWLKGYAAGLYLRDKASAPALVLAQAGPKRIQMKMLLDVEAAEFIKAIEKGLRRNHDEAGQAALKTREQQFLRNVSEVVKLRKGDEVNLDFVPATGLTLTVNGKVYGPAVPGADFYSGVLRIFIGDRPLDKRLKAGLLGAAQE